jgi:hydroxymethylpyrimidine pyrophosphatase-like HAD family hydrolase
MFSSMDELPLLEYASMRFFVMKNDASFLQQAIETSSGLSSFIMKDSYHEDVRVVQVTAKGASKGAALRYLCKKFSPVLGTIAAGDDCNDLDLLETADIGIAVGDAPEELRKIAYTTASSPEVLHLALERAKNILLQRK